MNDDFDQAVARIHRRKMKEALVTAILKGICVGLFVMAIMLANKS